MSWHPRCNVVMICRLVSSCASASHNKDVDDRDKDKDSRGNRDEGNEDKKDVDTRDNNAIYHTPDLNLIARACTLRRGTFSGRGIYVCSHRHTHSHNVILVSRPGVG